MRVLLVDDNRLMLEGLQNLLEAHQIQVAGLASDGLQGLDLARSLKPDVILMDLIKAFYPDLLPEHAFFYYQALQ